MHESVLLNECIEKLNVKDDGIYVDGTLGFGGHSSEVLRKLKRGFLFAFDQDDMAISYSIDKLSKISANFSIIKSNFVNIKIKLKEQGIEKVDGIMFDLGVSSPQLDIDDRGFSYHKDAKLDMRMDRDNKLSAYNVVNEYSYEKLTNIFWTYGEEKYAKSIAKKIMNYRDNKKIDTTLELVNIIKSGMPMKAMRDSHPARKIFQAIRIEVNNELDVLEKALIDSIFLLNKGGRICVITFHSLEDRIVKNVFKKYSEIDEKLKGLPFIPDEYQPIIKLINNKPILPSKEEIEKNNRARSAKLRVIERIR